MQQPLFFTDKSKKEELISNTATFVNAFESQLRELFEIESLPKTLVEEDFKSSAFKKFSDLHAENFTYVYFPWNNHLVKTVTKDLYLKLKTNRNQDLITAQEQKELRNFSVAVLGLSVGSNIALTLTQAGISNTILLADFDDLETTNLNRILGGVHQVGKPKIDVTSQKLYEDNPFSNIIPLREGVNEMNLRPHLEAGTLNCLIDEIDDIGLKIKIRKLAHEFKIPVLMVTDNGDGIVLHIERYDLGHDRIFGKPITEWQNRDLTNLSKEEAGKIIIGDIVGGPQNVDPRMIASVQRVMNRELVSWSQLGSAALLGGVFATVFLKEIALARLSTPDVRLFVNPLELPLDRHDK